MALELETSFAPMEARSVDEIPRGENWLYEPKWDGFRCLAFRNGDEVHLQSKSGQPLARYFPELVDALLQLKSDRFVLDGEIVIPDARGHLSFDQLLQRIHPAASRIKKLSVETPAVLIVFDLLADTDGKSMAALPLAERRKTLDKFSDKHFGVAPKQLKLSPATTDYELAAKWFGSAGAALDGIMAKRLDEHYHSGDRDGMVKIKPVRSAECVVGGFRYAAKEKVVGSLLLGLYDKKGLLNHIGYCSAMKTQMRRELTPQLEALVEAPGFTGAAPGGPSRWSTDRSADWQPLRPELVVEVEWDHFTNGRFRHGTKFMRWRPDKAPGKCTLDQVETSPADAFQMLD